MRRRSSPCSDRSTDPRRFLLWGEPRRVCRHDRVTMTSLQHTHWSDAIMSRERIRMRNDSRLRAVISPTQYDDCRHDPKEQDRRQGRDENQQADGPRNLQVTAKDPQRRHEGSANRNRYRQFHWPQELDAIGHVHFPSACNAFFVNLRSLAKILRRLLGIFLT